MPNQGSEAAAWAQERQGRSRGGAFLGPACSLSQHLPTTCLIHDLGAVEALVGRERLHRHNRAVVLHPGRLVAVGQHQQVGPTTERVAVHGPGDKVYLRVMAGGLPRRGAAGVASRWMDR